MHRAKRVLFVACLVPTGLVIWHSLTGGLGANPIEAITHATGDWTLRFLLLTLSISPLRRLTGGTRSCRCAGCSVYSRSTTRRSTS